MSQSVSSTPGRESNRKRGRSSPLDKGVQATKRVLSVVLAKKSDGVLESAEVEDATSTRAKSEAGLSCNSEQDGLVAAIAGIFDMKFELLGSKIDDLRTAMEDLKSFQGETRTALKCLRTTVAETRDSLGSLRSTVTEMSTRQDFTDARLTAVDEALAAHTGELRAIRDDMSSLQQRVTAAGSATALRTCTGTEVLSATSSGYAAAAAATVAPLDQAIQQPSRGITQAEVRDIIAEEKRREQIRTNVILSGLPESDEEDLNQAVVTLFPEVESSSLRTSRIGKSLNDRPRLVCIRTDDATKKIIMQKKRKGLMYGKHKVYVNHDLTRKQRDTRKQCVTLFKRMKEKGIQCSLPVDRILVNGKPVSDQEISKLLDGAAADGDGQ